MNNLVIGHNRIQLKMKELEKQIAELNYSNKIHENNIEILQNELSKKEIELNEKDVINKELASALKNTHEELGLSQVNCTNKLHEIHILNNSLILKDSIIQNINNNLSQLSQEYKNLQNYIESTVEKNTKLKLSLDEKQNEIIKLNEVIISLQNDLSSVINERAQIYNQNTLLLSKFNIETTSTSIQTDEQIECNEEQESLSKELIVGNTRKRIVRTRGR